MLRNFFSRFFGRFSSLSGRQKAAVIVIILASGFLIVRKITSGKSDGYLFDTVQRRDITELVSESGNISASGQVGIYSSTTGIVDGVFVQNGDTVKSGQKLFSVKSTATPQEKSAAYAAYKAAVSAVQQAENTRRSTQATVDRVHDDLKDKSGTEDFSEKEERTAAEVANDNAWDALLAARAQLTSAQSAYQATQNSTVTSPVEGTVSNLSVTSGTSVSVNSLLAPVGPVLVVAGSYPTEVSVSVGETDINKVRVGQTATIKADAVDSRDYQGTVTRMDRHGTVTQGVVKFNVYLEVTDADDLLRSGMTADVDITTDKVEGVLSVPNSAVKPYQKGRAVRVLGNNSKIEYIPVKIGIRGKEFTQILEGVNEGQSIIVSLTNEKVQRSSPLGF